MIFSTFGLFLICSNVFSQNDADVNYLHKTVINNKLRSSNKHFMAYLNIITGLLMMANFFRYYIAIWGWQKLGRMPTFFDGHKIKKPIFIGWVADEWFLVWGHFLTPLLIVAALFIIIRAIVLAEQKFFSWPVLLALFIMGSEIALRCTTAYSYVMYD